MSITVKELIRQLRSMPQDAHVWFSDSADLFPSCSVEFARDDSEWGDKAYRTITLLGPTRLRPTDFEEHVPREARPLCDRCGKDIRFFVDLCQLQGKAGVISLHAQCWRELGEPLTAAKYLAIKAQNKK